VVDADRRPVEHRELRHSSPAERSEWHPKPRSVPARAQARRRRDGRRLSGDPRHAQAPHGGEAVATRARRPRGVRPLSARSAADGDAQASAHHHDLRLWPHSGGLVLLRDGAPRGREPARRGRRHRASTRAARRAYPARRGSRSRPMSSRSSTLGS
jgi:hypothetical protein